MLYRFFSFSLLWITIFNGQGQNLVPNPSFEGFDNGCHEDINEMPTGWSRWRSSPDSFSTCVEPETFIDSLGWAPWNGFGFQEPAEGESYVGLSAFSPSPKPDIDPEYREYIGCELIDPLESGSTYFVSFKTSLGFTGSYFNMTYACNRLGILFTNQSFDWEEDPMPVPNSAHIYSEEIISDTANWITISGTFVADQNYTHMGIGVFFQYDLLQVLELVPGLSLGSYYYIDDVCVSTSQICMESSEIRAFNDSNSYHIIYPNPATNVANFNQFHDLESLEVLNEEGRLVREIHRISGSMPSISVSELPDGIYLFIFHMNSGIHREKLQIVH